MMKKLLFLMLLVLMIVPARAEYDYDSWVTSPETLEQFATIIKGTVISIIEQDVDDAGQISSLIIINLDDEQALPVVLRNNREEGVALPVYPGWKVRFIGQYHGVLPVKSDLGFYIAMPVFETESLIAVPADQELPIF
jgi:hypothetical protein